MAISLLSPQVHVEEYDNSLYSQSAATSMGAAVISANWGPVNDPQFIDNENTLVNIFGQPNDQNYKNWLTAANFLAYSGQMMVARIDTHDQFNANAKGVTGWETEMFENSSGEMVPVRDENGDPVLYQQGVKINNDVDYAAEFADGNANDFGEFAARYPGALGNSIMVTYADANTFDQWTWTDSNGNIYDWRQEFGSAPNTSSWALARDGHNDEMHLLVVDAGGRITGQKGTILEKYSFLSKASDARDSDGVSNYYKRVLQDQSEYVYCMDLPLVESLVPFFTQTVLTTLASEDEEAEYIRTHNVVAGDKIIVMAEQMVRIAAKTKTIDDQGYQKTSISFADYANLSDWADKKQVVYKQDEEKAFRIDYDSKHTITITEVSIDTNATWGSSVTNNTFLSLKKPYCVQLSGGADDYEYTDGDEMIAWDSFANKERFDIGLCVTGAATSTVAKYVIENICETRMDCVAFISPTTNDRGPILGNLTQDDRNNGITSSELKILNRTLEYRNSPNFNVNSSYGHLDSGWKYQYDKYNDCNRWVPLNGDCAGLYARVDQTNNPWTVAAGYNRGQIKNVIKLSYSPNKAHRDQLYPQQINPVVTFTGEGTILYGSKSLLTKPSAFDRLNVRRLFIYLEKTLSESAKYLLFELNNASTRSYAVNVFDPVLRNVAGLGGVYAYKIVCDETNNTPDLIDKNQLVVDLYISPSKSIDFITLRFVCERTGSSVFSESGA